MDIQLKPGDVVGTENPMWLGKAINAIQWLWSGDGESKYSHSLIIKDDENNTFEALWTVRSQNFFKAYKGKRVIIARPKVGSAIIDEQLWVIIKKHKGQFYPAWRIIMHIIPPLAKIAIFDRLVCSELVAKFLCLIGARHEQYKGTNPDRLADEWRRWKTFDIIFEGVLE